MAIELRISADELIEGGLRLDEMIEYAKMIEDKIDLLHVSVGVLADHNVMLRMEPAIYYEHGINVHYATEIRKHVSIPVVTIGGITDIEMIEDIIANDKADVVSLARALLADHELPNKARKGRAEDIRPCTRCVACMRLTGEHVHPLRCAVNPIAGRELEFSYIPDAKEPKNIVVVGGGPAGMEAAIVASDRGHKVTLFEQNEELGGMLNHAAVLPFKDDTLRFRNWLVNQTLKRKDKIDIRLGVKATPDMVSEMEPDAVVVALGAEPIRPRIPAEDPSMVVDALEVDAGKIEVGDRVVVAGGGITGLECGLNLAQNGKDVTIIDMIPKSEFGKEGPRGTVYFLEQAGAKFVTEVKLMRVTKEGAVVQDRNWNEFVIPCDTVICAFGLKSRRKEAEEFKDVAYDVFYVGDVKEVHDIRRAIHSAFNLMVDYE
jgi:NADPH-dependent 2,4-dienoyl-CoA reductase/sulfur reductase-like enzyme